MAHNNVEIAGYLLEDAILDEEGRTMAVLELASGPAVPADFIQKEMYRDPRPRGPGDPGDPHRRTGPFRSQLRLASSRIRTCEYVFGYQAVRPKGAEWGRGRAGRFAGTSHMAEFKEGCFPPRICPAAAPRSTGKRQEPPRTVERVNAQVRAHSLL
ncbi:MAG: hypothetical protein ACREMZ_15860, partial [Gemmatimonadales bacterium]